MTGAWMTVDGRTLLHYVPDDEGGGRPLCGIDAREVGWAPENEYATGLRCQRCVEAIAARPVP